MSEPHPWNDAQHVQAPDGLRVLVFVADQQPGYRVHFGRYVASIDLWRIDHHSGDWSVTHWAPVPPDPPTPGA